jgi:hypothetical protein
MTIIDKKSQANPHHLKEYLTKLLILFSSVSTFVFSKTKKFVDCDSSFAAAN